MHVYCRDRLLELATLSSDSIMWDAANAFRRSGDRATNTQLVFPRDTKACWGTISSASNLTIEKLHYNFIKRIFKFDINQQ